MREEAVQLDHARNFYDAGSQLLLTLHPTIALAPTQIQREDVKLVPRESAPELNIG